MERVRDEVEVKVTGGIGWFFFALIPGAIAGALLMYFAFYTGVIDWQKAQRIEGRMDNRVGVNGELTKPVDLIIRKASCLEVSRAYLDSGVLTAYVTNNCHTTITYWEWHFNQIAPDGTIINSWYDNSLEGPEVGQTVERTQKLKEDDRTSKVVVWTTTR